MTFDWTKHAQHSGEWVRFDNIGDKVVGHVVGVRAVTFPGDDEETVIIDMDTGGEASVSLKLGPKNLKRQLVELGPQVGDKLGVTFTGTERLPGKPQPLKLFDVQHRVGERPQPTEEEQWGSVEADLEAPF